MTTLGKALILSSILVTASSLALAQQSRPPIVGGTIVSVKVDVKGVVAKGYRASKLIGSAIYNDKKKMIGSVGDLIVSTNGAVNLVIVDVGGFLGVGAKHIAIPAQLFKPGKNNRIVLPGATRKHLMAMPPFRFAS